MKRWLVPLFDTHFGQDEQEAVAKVLRSGWLTMGETVQALEARFAAHMDGAFAVAVNSCTAGLHLAFAALGIGPGDEVVLPSLTFVATANAVRYVGATPVFADIAGLDDPCISPAGVTRHITPRTRAICVVHYAGFPCDMRPIMEVARAHDIPVVEDCAHALFSSVGGTPCGVWGDVGVFSFFSNKNMTCGEGGMVVTRRGELAERCRLLRSHGMTSVTLDRHEGRAHSYDVVSLGYNYRLDELRAALALAQLERLPAFLEQRRALWPGYVDRLTRQTPACVPHFGNRSTDVGFHILPVVLPQGMSRDAVARHLRERGVLSSVHYPPVHSFSAYSGRPARLPLTEAFAARELTLPFFPGMSAGQVTTVVEALAEAVAA
jgi:dTDP-4-amino-4,6-dideoxygalactose transaminase